MILSPFEHFVEKSGETVFQKFLLPTAFLMSKLLKYNFFVVLSSFLQNFAAYYIVIYPFKIYSSNNYYVILIFS